MSDATVLAIKKLSVDEALSWIRSQPGEVTDLGPVALAARWGWRHQAVSRQLSKWVRDGVLVRRGKLLYVAGSAPQEPRTKSPFRAASYVHPRTPVVKDAAQGPAQADSPL